MVTLQKVFNEHSMGANLVKDRPGGVRRGEYCETLKRTRCDFRMKSSSGHMDVKNRWIPLDFSELKKFMDGLFEKARTPSRSVT